MLFLFVMHTHNKLSRHNARTHVHVLIAPATTNTHTRTLARDTHNTHTHTCTYALTHALINVHLYTHTQTNNAYNHTYTHKRAQTFMHTLKHKCKHFAHKSICTWEHFNTHTGLVASTCQRRSFLPWPSLRFNTTRPERIPSSRSASASFHDSMCLDAKGSNPNTLILCECMSRRSWRLT